MQSKKKCSLQKLCIGQNLCHSHTALAVGWHPREDSGGISALPTERQSAKDKLSPALQSCKC